MGRANHRGGRYLVWLWLLLGMALGAHAANPQLYIVGTNPSGTDNTAFVDNLVVTRVSTGLPVGGAVSGPGFEAPNLGNAVFQYNPAGTPWTFNPQSGIAQNNSGFGAPTAPEGVQAAFLQGLGSLTQNMALTTGTYILTFQTAQRNCCSGTNNQSLSVYVAGVLVGTIQPANNNLWQTFTSAPFTVDAPAVTALAPARNARTAALASAVAVTFSQLIDNATAGNIRVFSAQRGGRKAGSYTTSSGTVTFTPTVGFRPGETVFASIPATVKSTGGAPTTPPQVYQFTTAVGGTGRGNFLGGSDPVVGSTPAQVVPADVDGDGDLDIIVTAVAFNNTGPNTAYVRLNNGSGVFSGGSNVAVGANPVNLAVGDVDGDGDLDFVTANENANTASVRVNDGSGAFGGTQEVGVGIGPYSVVFGDVDGDGDLDLVTANYNHGNGSNTASVRLNGGDASGSNTGIFSAGSNPAVISSPNGLALGDADNDGDLDLFTFSFGNTVNVRLNNGSGTFAGGTTFTTVGFITSLVLGDVNGDGYLDAVTANYSSNTASVRLNNGSGTFAGGSDLSFAATVSTVALGDVDADGDLDLVATNNGMASMRLNNGSATFAGGSDVSLGGTPFGLALADVDGDLDLDLLAANYSASGTVNVRLNQSPAPTITGFSPNPAGAGLPVTLTGTNLAGATALAINGAAATILTNTATNITFRVPAGATATGTSSVTTPGGTASSTAFAVLPAPGNALALDGADDYATGTMALLPQGNTARTLEAWVLTTTSGGVIFNYGAATANQRSGILVSGVGRLYYVGENNDLQGNITITDGKWHHVAASYNGTTLSLYVDGVLDVSSGMPAFGTTGTSWNLGKRIPPLTSTELFNGRIDEVRVYNTALTLAQVQADMRSTSPALPGNLVAYFSFDQGTASGNNAGLTTLYDQSSNAYTGALTNYTSPGLTSGNATSNWVESYALVLPTATTATAVAGTSFTANWTAPTIGSAVTYYVDVATDPAFATGLSTSSVAAPATSLSITGRANATTYYYRVRAEKTAAIGQGASYSYATVTTLALPTITSFLPTSGAAGTSVTLTGTNLAGATSLSVNGVAVTPTGVGSTSLTFVVPAGASALQSITVTTPGGTSAASTAFAVLLNVASTSPAANARTAATTNSATAATFTEPVTAASAASLKVFSAQLGGLKAGNVTVAGNTASFAATASTVLTNFKPGETVSVTVPATVLSAGGLAAAKRVYQFTTAVGGLGRGNFTGTQNPAVSSGAQFVATGDVNGDGSLDLVTTNFGTAVVSIRLNDGTGTYAGGSDPAVGSAAKGVALGDVDGDGDLDFVTANDAAGTASVRLNDGLGSFGGSQEVTVGANPYCVALGDIDGDGDLDLLTGNAGGVNISTRFNDGTGTFLGGTDLSTSGYRLAGLVLGDLDGDGDLDLAGASYVGAVLIRLNNGAGVFSGSTNLTGAAAQAVAMGDMDADGDLDIVAVNGLNASTLTIWRNGGNATFTNVQSLVPGAQPYGVAFGDVDADGDLDLAVACRNASSLNLYLNDGLGTYTNAPGVAIAALGSSGVAFGDVDADGDLDLLATGNNTVSVRLNQAPAPAIISFTPTSGLIGTTVTITGTNLTGATAVAFNGTAAAGFVVNSATQITATVAVGSTTGTISVATPGGTATSTATFTVLVPLNVTALSPARNARAAATGTAVAVTFDQTPTAASAANIRVFSAQYKGLRTATAAVAGNTATLTPTGGSFRAGELVNVTIPATVQSSAGAPANNQVYQFTTATSGTGRGNFVGGADYTVGSGPQRLALGDVDGDGDLDMATANFSANNVTLLLNGGDNTGSNTGIFSNPTSLGTGQSPNSVALGDLDGDGDLDMVVANANQVLTSVRINSGLNSGTFVAGTDIAIQSRTVYLNDVNGDGFLDLVACAVSNTVRVRLNNGSGVFSTSNALDLSLGTASYTIAIGDIDADGDLDLATANGDANQVRIFSNSGTGVFTNSATLSVNRPYNGSVFADTDGDGDLDLLVNSSGSGTYVYANSGLNTGTFPSGTYVSTGGGYNLAVGDIDADGDPDMLVVGTNSVAVRFNTGGTFSGSTNLSLTSVIDVALGDMDGDGDLDLTAVSSGTGIALASVRFNQLPAPAITSIAVNPGGLGQSITLTGSNLANATALTINGANAFANILSNSATSVVVRVPTTATASGTIGLTTVGGTATSGTFTLMSPPGNALAFDGVDDQLTTTATAPAFGTGSFTIEAWVRTSTTSTNNFVAVGSVNGNDYWLGLNNQRACISVSGGGCVGTSLINDGRWHHLAGVRSGTQLTIYVDGRAETTITNTFGASPAAPLSIGNFTGGYYWPGSIDEVRLWNVAQVPTLASRTTPALGTEPGLVLAYNFDQGTPATAGTGNNAGLTTLYDLVSAQPATLAGFALASGNTTSNWVESYALVVPTATAATVPAANGFTANWTAPATGTATSYRLDVSAAADFSSATPGSPFTVAAPTLSRTITGLAAGTTYYYRVRADKTSVTGQGTPSNTIAVATCAPPVAIAQNAGVTLDALGNATLAATAVNNGSTANCGPAAAGALSVSPSSFTCVDAVPATVASALIFDGSSQYVEGTNANLPLGNAARTIEAWVYTTNGYGAIFNYGTPATNQRAGLLLNGSSKLYYVGEFNDLQGNIVMSLNAWHHVAATYDGATLKLYVDGVLDVQANPGAFNTTGTIWRIAQRSAPQTGEFLTGRVDEVRVWNVARTAAQLAANKNVGLPGGTAGLVAYYRLNEGSGGTTADASASASVGTLYNNPTWTTTAPAVTNGVPVTLTVTDAGGNTATAPAIVTVSVPATPTTTWNGNLSTSPLACQNWSYGQLPDAATNAVIPAFPTRYPTLSTGTLTTKDLTINSGSILTADNGTTLQLNGSFTNNGPPTIAGTVAFVGSAALQTMNNSSTRTLIVNKPTGTVQLAQNLSIVTALTMTSGTLTTTSSYQVNLGSAATLSESETSYVLGKVVVNRTLSPGTAEPFAGLGLTLTPAAGSTAPGATLVTRTTGTAISGAGTSQSILRAFDISPATNTGLNVTMDFAYFIHELNGIPGANLALFKSVSGGTPWIPQRGTTAAGNVVTKTGITDFSVWTLGNAANPLPVELTTFTATAQGRTVQLKWTTASEKNTARFEVERSLDGTAFERIGTVAAAGTSTTPRSYGFDDNQIPKALSPQAPVYYRLRQVDADATFSYSPVRSVRLSEAAEGLALYPNPTTARTTLSGAQPGSLVQVFDALGRVVAAATADATGSATLALPAGLASGVYVVRTGNKALRLTVE